MEQALRVAAWSAERTQGLINMWLESTFIYNFSHSPRNLHLYWEVLGKMAQADLHRTPAQWWEGIKHLKP